LLLAVGGIGGGGMLLNGGSGQNWRAPRIPALHFTVGFRGASKQKRSFSGCTHHDMF
jgi:hypothetical protein